MIQPLHDRVLVRRIQQEQGLIVLTDAEKSRRCEVLAVGPGRWDAEREEFKPIQVKAGQTVIVSPSINNEAWTDIIQRGDEVLIQEADILVVCG